MTWPRGTDWPPPLAACYVCPIHGFGGVFGMTTAVLITGAMSVLILGIPTTNRSLKPITKVELPLPDLIDPSRGENFLDWTIAEMYRLQNVFPKTMPYTSIVGS